MSTAPHAFITGASSGIGRELAILLSQNNYRLSITGRNIAKLNETSNLIRNRAQVFAEAVNLSDSLAREKLLKGVVEQNGFVDLLINCAGVNNHRGPGSDVPLDALAALMEINFYAPVALMQGVIPQMRERQSGVIVNILSTTCLFSNPSIAAYTASKAALDAYAKVMRKELRSEGIKMLSAYPGGVNTDFREADRPEYLSARAVATAIFNMLEADANTHIHELVIRPECETNFC